MSDFHQKITQRSTAFQQLCWWPLCWLERFAGSKALIRYSSLHIQRLFEALLHFCSGGEYCALSWVLSICRWITPVQWLRQFELDKSKAGAYAHSIVTRRSVNSGRGPNTISEATVLTWGLNFKKNDGPYVCVHVDIIPQRLLSPSRGKGCYLLHFYDLTG